VPPDALFVAPDQLFASPDALWVLPDALDVAPDSLFLAPDPRWRENLKPDPDGFLGCVAGMMWHCGGRMSSRARPTVAGRLAGGLGTDRFDELKKFYLLQMDFLKKLSAWQS
jgi:hypothetical protein